MADVKFNPKKPDPSYPIIIQLVIEDEEKLTGQQ